MKEERMNDFEKYVWARNHVEKIKNYYANVVFFLITVLLLVLLKGSIIDFAAVKVTSDEGFLRWLKLNMTIVPIIWGIVLAIIGIYLLKPEPGFLKKWEKRQIQKFMENQEDESRTL